MRIIAAGSAVITLVLALFLLRPAPIALLDAKSSDLLTAWAGPGTPSGRVVVVEVDERSLAQFGRWPWARDRVGELSRRILDSGASTLVLDMMFPQEEGASDAALASALSGKPAIIGYTLRFDSGDAAAPPCPVPALPLVVVGPGVSSGGAAFFHATGEVCSAPEISWAAAGSGFLNAAPDSDGTLRRVPLVIASGDRYYPSLALAALKSYRHVSTMQLSADAHGAVRLRLDHQSIPLEDRSLLRLRFRGARRTFPYVSAAGILSGGAPLELLRGKIVIVGASAPGIQVPVVTAVDAQFPDVEIQATAIDNLLQGDSFRRPGDAEFWELALALLAGALSTFLLARLHAVWAAAATLALAAAVWIACALALSSGGMLFSPLPATATLVCNLPVLALLNYLREQKRADQAQRELAAATQHSLEVLLESESRYQRLVENVNDAIIMDDVDGRLLFANRRFREWFGLADAAVPHVPLEEYVAPEWRAEVRARHDRRMRGETVPDHFEFEGVRSDGTHIWIEALVTTIEENGRIIGSQAALRDITERKRMEAQYLQAQKMESIGRLAGGVAHDFNNLLTVINGYSAMLMGRLPPEDQFRQGLDRILNAGEHAAELTRKLLTFSRKQMVRPQPLNLNVLVTESQNLWERLIGEDIQLITRLSPDLGSVVADPSQIQQVLMNLVVNARDAMPDGGKVTIETKNTAGPSGPHVYLGVADSGIGMNEEVQRHLFEPFFTTKDQGKGTGFGLATVYGIIHQSSGRIEVSSEVGRGTTFHIYLPRVQPAEPEQPAPLSSPSALKGTQTVLVVEDQDAVRQLACTILESYSYRVLQASNGPDAIALAERYPEPIHLLLTDIILPLMDGRVLADKLAAIRPDIKVLFISGYSDETIARSTAPDRDLAYLAKPFTSETLATRVRDILTDEERRHGRATTD